ncbi:Dot/Icm secretion system substrate [Legionella busanensis]|uniref:Dot/Icm secretion system substrate n=1 Tax=Legionella busanensis TaxID=190655 RepID=A0A378JJ28_9GAMM|nr:hypothetical protein [Legionella busanensis]STX51067.1 Dot/Icm secretion system substrate [Legionella busanensis]
MPPRIFKGNFKEAINYLGLFKGILDEEKNLIKAVEKDHQRTSFFSLNYTFDNFKSSWNITPISRRNPSISNIFAQGNIDSAILVSLLFSFQAWYRGIWPPDFSRELKEVGIDEVLQQKVIKFLKKQNIRILDKITSPIQSPNCPLTTDEQRRFQEAYLQYFYSLKNKQRLRLGYMDAEGKPCGFAIEFNHANPNWWVASIIKNTTAPPDEREVIIFSNPTEFISGEGFSTAPINSVVELLPEALNSTGLANLLAPLFKADNTINANYLIELNMRLISERNIDDRDKKRQKLFRLNKILAVLNERGVESSNLLIARLNTKIAYYNQKVKDDEDFFKKIIDFNNEFDLLLLKSIPADSIISLEALDKEYQSFLERACKLLKTEREELEKQVSENPLLLSVNDYNTPDCIPSTPKSIDNILKRYKTFIADTQKVLNIKQKKLEKKLRELNLLLEIANNLNAEIFNSQDVIKRIKRNLRLKILNNLLEPAIVLIPIFRSASLGAITGAILGTFVFPGIGTGLGAAIGAGIGGGLGGVEGFSLGSIYELWKDNPKLSTALSVLGSAGMGAGIGALIGTFIFPGVGTAIGAAFGAGIGAGIGFIINGIGNLIKINSKAGTGLTILGTTGLGTTIGALIGTCIFPVIGTAVGAGIGAGIGFAKGLVISGLIHCFNGNTKEGLGLTTFGSAGLTAGLGALIGSLFFPGPGTAIGAAVGGIIPLVIAGCKWLYDKYKVYSYQKSLKVAPDAKVIPAESEENLEGPYQDPEPSLAPISHDNAQMPCFEEETVVVETIPSSYKKMPGLKQGKGFNSPMQSPISDTYTTSRGGRNSPIFARKEKNFYVDYSQPVVKNH